MVVALVVAGGESDGGSNGWQIAVVGVIGVVVAPNSIPQS